MAIKVLYAEDEEDLRDVVVFDLESEFSDLDMEILQAGTGDEAISLIKANSDISIVISDYNMPHGTGGDVYRYCSSHRKDIKFILCSSSTVDELPEFKNNAEIAGAIEKPNIMEPLVALMRELTKKVKATETSTGNYLRIQMRTLRKISVLPTDVYLKLSEGKFIKVLKAGDVFGTHEEAHYKTKRASDLYVLQSDAQLVSKVLAQDILNVLFKKPPELPAHLISQEVVETVGELISLVGVVPQTQELATQAVQHVMAEFEQNKDFAPIADYFVKFPDTYLAKHSLLVSQIACVLATALGWGSKSTFHKITYAGMLHDMTLGSTEVLALQSLDQERDSGRVSQLEVKERAFFKTHALQAAALSREFPMLGEDVERMVEHHHEQPDGSGVPYGINFDQFTPMSALFWIAHDFLNWIHRLTGDQVTLKKTGDYFSHYLDSWPASWDHGDFKKIRDQLRA